MLRRHRSMSFRIIKQGRLGLMSARDSGKFHQTGKSHIVGSCAY